MTGPNRRVDLFWKRAAAVVSLATLLAPSGCFRALPSDGGGQLEDVELPRPVDETDVIAPDGYRVEPVMAGLTFPTAVIFDDKDNLYVVESGYSYGEVWTTPRLLRFVTIDQTQVVAVGEKGYGPWTGGAFHEGAFYIADGSHTGRILRVELDGTITPIVEGLPSLGDHHTNGPAIGPDGMIYFGQGTVTNSGVVGTDNYDFGWLKRHPTFHDVPCRDIRVKGVNYTTPNPLTPGEAEVMTGPFSPFGTSVPSEGRLISGSVPCSGAIMRVSPEGGAPELVAWGLRNPFGLKFSPDGSLYVTENGFDLRGSRPIFGASDNLWVLDPKKPVVWYGWPDYSAGRPVTEAHDSPFNPAPQLILAEHPGRPPLPVARFAVHSSANGLDISRNERFGHAGEAFVALFGDLAPNVGKVLDPVGFQVVRVDPKTGVIKSFLANRGEKSAPASYLGTAGLERPIDVAFDPIGEALYVVDFGIVTTELEGKTKSHLRTGVVWRVTSSVSPMVVQKESK